MMRMKVSVFLMFLWILTVSRGDSEVSCVFMETCILPCSFQVGPHVNILWIQMKGLRVHSYYNNQDLLKYQHQLYRNRTSLFKDQISRGNASLQLTGVKVQDEGRYKCRISTPYKTNDSIINLKVYGSSVSAGGTNWMMDKITMVLITAAAPGVVVAAVGIQLYCEKKRGQQENNAGRPVSAEPLFRGLKLLTKRNLRTATEV